MFTARRAVNYGCLYLRHLLWRNISSRFCCDIVSTALGGTMSLLLFYGQLLQQKTNHPLLIGKGTERYCFQLLNDIHTVVKISYSSKAKQTRREINYFQFLMQHKIPFTHLPKFKGTLRNRTYIALLQERILNKNTTPSCTLKHYLQHTRSANYSEIQQMLIVLFRYLYRYNILPCDLQTDNLLVQQNHHNKKLILVDGLGCTDFIKIAQYIPWFGRRKILHKIRIFLHQYAPELTLNPREIDKWLLSVKKP